MAVSKVILNGDTLMDVTQDSVTAPTLLSGETATGADGMRLTGTATVPTPSTTTPAMDGTAAAGTSTDYARADHVHPTDTSRAAASHTHAIADVTGLQTALDGKQPTLVSGTSIKTVNGTSLLGSGDITTPTYTLPEATTDTLGGVKVDGTTITATDGVISAVGGGGGGVSYATQAVRILASAWSNMTATVNASAATATNDVIVTPAPESVSAWASAGIYCSAQGDGTLTFACKAAPTEAVTANVMAFEGGETIVPSTYSVTITTTNPRHSGDAPAIACKLYESVSGSYGSGTDAGTWALGTQIGQMGHTDSTTVEIGREMYGIVAVFADDQSTSVSDSGVTCTGGVSNEGAINGRVLLKVDGDGTATIDGVDYDW